MAEQIELFPVDGQLLRLLPRAGASLRNPDVNLPVLRSDGQGYYLEMKIDADPNEESEVALTRRLPLDDISGDEWEELKNQYDSLDLEAYLGQGGIKGLEKIEDRRLQRWTVALLTYLNPRQVAIVLYLYRAASEQNSSSVATFRSNDLLEVMGYKRTKDGGFTARVRSQLHCDIMALHRTELLYAEELRRGDTPGAKVKIKNILRVKEFEVDNVPRDLELEKAADFTFESADAYTVSLGFFEEPTRAGDYVLFGNSIDATQRQGSSAKHNYKIKLLVYLAGRLKWDSPKDGQFLRISKQCLYKNLDLLGRNSARNNEIFWRTVGELKDEDYILGAQELPGKRKTSSVEFQINPEQIRSHGE
jgi:hypothetical protein